MKIRPFVLFAALLLVSTALHAAQVPKLDTLLAEYKKARTDVLGKLREAYASQADILADQYLAMPDLEQAERARRYAKSLREPAKHEAREASFIVNDPAATDPITLLQANYLRAREENVNNVYTFYSTTAESLRRELLRSKDKAGAEVLTAFLEKIKSDEPAAIGTASTPAKTRKSPGK